MQVWFDLKVSEFGVFHATLKGHDKFYEGEGVYEYDTKAPGPGSMKARSLISDSHTGM